MRMQSEPHLGSPALGTSSSQGPPDSCCLALARRHATAGVVLNAGIFLVSDEERVCGCWVGAWDGCMGSRGSGAESHSVHSSSLHCSPGGQAHSVLAVRVQLRRRTPEWHIRQLSQWGRWWWCGLKERPGTQGLHSGAVPGPAQSFTRNVPGSHMGQHLLTPAE